MFVYFFILLFCMSILYVYTLFHFAFDKVLLKNFTTTTTAVFALANVLSENRLLTRKTCFFVRLNSVNTRHYSCR